MTKTVTAPCCRALILAVSLSVAANAAIKTTNVNLTGAIGGGSQFKVMWDPGGNMFARFWPDSVFTYGGSEFKRFNSPVLPAGTALMSAEVSVIIGDPRGSISAVGDPGVDWMTWASGVDRDAMWEKPPHSAFDFTSSASMDGCVGIGTISPIAPLDLIPICRSALQAGSVSFTAMHHYPSTETLTSDTHQKALDLGRQAQAYWASQGQRYGEFDLMLGVSRNVSMTLTMTYDDPGADPAETPEPGTFAILAASLGAVAMRRRIASGGFAPPWS